jgi:hypothetical protein
MYQKQKKITPCPFQLFVTVNISNPRNENDTIFERPIFNLCQLKVPYN